MSLLIPHIIHAIWVGNNPLPPVWQTCWSTWKHHHPTWATYLLTDKDQFAQQTLSGFPEVTDLRQKADILRYALLYRYGGIYVDIDFECLRPLDKDDLLDNVSLFAARESDEHEAISIGIMGCTELHPAMRDLGQNLATSIRRYQDVGSQTGPSFFTRVIGKHPELTVFPQRLFYPYEGSDAMKGIPFDKSKAPNAYAVHHWRSLTKVEGMRTQMLC